MTDTPMPRRCRIVLVAPPGADDAALPRLLADALDGGDVASVILPRYDRDEQSFQRLAERVAPVVQDRGAAFILAGDTRVAGRIGADGNHLDEGPAAVAEAVQRARGKTIVGAGGIRTRDDALTLGDLEPDYLYFGRFGHDDRPAPHPRNLDLGAWFAEMVAIPCVVEAGSTLESVDAVAATGAEFVALSSAVFAGPLPPGEAVAEANRRLDAAPVPGA